MESRPIQRKGEKMLAYYNRVNEWEQRARIEAKLESRAIDRATRRAKFQNEKAITAQVKYDRRSLHDQAQHNPVLKRILIRMQKEARNILDIS